MALPFSKLTILLGAGIVGSVLAKEGPLSNVSGFASDALKIVLKQLRQDDSGSSDAKPRNDSLMQQISSLRQELQLLASSRSVTIVTSSGSGSGRYGVVVVVVVVGYGYIWWKGWRLSDMMFATRRGLADACGNVAKQLERVYTSISATKKLLSSRIDQVDSKIDECADTTAAIRGEVSELRGDVQSVGFGVETVHHVVVSLETKISRIEEKQNETNFLLGNLVSFVRSIGSNRTMEPIEAGPSGSSRRPLELPPSTPSRAASLPTNSLLEAPSPSVSGGSDRHPLQSALLASGLQELPRILDETSSPTPDSIHATGEARNVRLIGRRFSGSSTSFLPTRSAMQSFK